MGITNSSSFQACSFQERNKNFFKKLYKHKGSRVTLLSETNFCLFSNIIVDQIVAILYGKSFYPKIRAVVVKLICSLSVRELM